MEGMKRQHEERLERTSQIVRDSFVRWWFSELQKQSMCLLSGKFGRGYFSLAFIFTDHIFLYDSISLKLFKIKGSEKPFPSKKSPTLILSNLNQKEVQIAAKRGSWAI